MIMSAADYMQLVNRPWFDGGRCVDIVREYFELRGEDPPKELTREYGDRHELTDPTWEPVSGVGESLPGDVVAQSNGDDSEVVTHVGVVVSGGWGGLTLTANKRRGSFLMRSSALKNIVGIYRRPENAAG